MSRNSQDRINKTDPEQAALRVLCDAICAKLDGMSVEYKERNTKNPDFWWTLLSAHVRHFCLRDKLDEKYVGIIGRILLLCQRLPEADRRLEVLKLCGLPVETPDAEVEASFRREISNSFEHPVDQTLVDRLLEMILAALPAGTICTCELGVVKGNMILCKCPASGRKLQ